MSSFIAFRSAAISLLRRPHARPFASAQPIQPAPAKSKFNIKVATAAKESAQADKTTNNKTPPRDLAIPHRFVRLVNPDTGKLTDLQPLRPLVASLDRRSHYIELVTEKPDPIVKIFDRYAEVTRAAEVAHRAREAARQNVRKEVQLSWGSAPADLAHKINKAREDLLSGARVDLVFARKKGQPKLDPAVMHERASEAIESLLDVSKEWKQRDVRSDQGLLALFLEATGTAEVAPDTADTDSQPETSGKKITLDTTLTDQGPVVRRILKELAKGTRVELVVSAKAGTPAEGEQDVPLTMDALHPRAEEVMKALRGKAKEWRDREYKLVKVEVKERRDREHKPVMGKAEQTQLKPVSAKLSIFLEKEGRTTKGKVVVHKGPKPKKVKPEDIPDLFQD